MPEKQLIPISSFVVKARRRQYIDYTAYILILIFLIVFTVLDIREYLVSAYYGPDFAFFSQALWNSMQGRILAITVEPVSPTVLGQHFSPLLLALIPFCTFINTSQVIAILPAILAAVSAIPLYWFARERIGRFLGLVVIIAYFLSPGVQFLALGQFHEIMLAVPLMMLGTYFLMRRHYVPFLICLGIALLAKEEIGLIAAAIGIYIVILQRRFFFGSGLLLFGLSYTLLLLTVVIPHLQGSTNYFAFGDTGDNGGQGMYAYLGGTVPEIIATLITHPSVAFSHLFTTPKIDALLGYLLPLGFIPIAGLELTALGIPILGYILLSDASHVYKFGSWHYASILPFLFLGMVVGLDRVLSWLDRRLSQMWRWQGRPLRWSTRGTLGILILLFGLEYYYQNPRSILGYYDMLRPGSVSEHALEARKIAQLIPEDAIVHTQSELAPYVSARRFIYIEAAIPCYGIADYVFLDKTRPWYGYREDFWQKLLARSDWQTLIDQDGYILKRRAPPTILMNAQYGDVLTLLGYTLNQTMEIQGGQTLAPIAVWRMERKTQSKYVISAKVVDSAGHVWATYVQEPGGGFCPTDSLRRGQTINDQMNLPLPPTMPAGSYDLQIGVYDISSGEYLPVRDSQGDRASNYLLVSRIEITKNKASFTASELRGHFQLDQPYYVDMGEMRFLGYIPPRKIISPGEPLSVEVYWRAREKPRGDYMVAVQLRDAMGNVVFEQMSRPAKGTYPTTEWNAGEVLLDWHDFNLPMDIVPGEYQIFVVLRDSASNRVLGQTAISSLTINR